jgi:hypothetical protein
LIGADWLRLRGRFGVSYGPNFRGRISLFLLAVLYLAASCIPDMYAGVTAEHRPAGQVIWWPRPLAVLLASLLFGLTRRYLHSAIVMVPGVGVIVESRSGRWEHSASECSVKFEDMNTSAGESGEPSFVQLGTPSGAVILCCASADDRIFQLVVGLQRFMAGDHVGPT